MRIEATGLGQFGLRLVISAQQGICGRQCLMGPVGAESVLDRSTFFVDRLGRVAQSKIGQTMVILPDAELRVMRAQSQP